VASLSDWHDQAPAKAAAGQHSHDAEIKEHGTPCVHVLGT